MECENNYLEYRKIIDEATKYWINSDNFDWFTRYTTRCRNTIIINGLINFMHVYLLLNPESQKDINNKIRKLLEEGIEF